MTDPRWDRVENLFDGALDQPESARTAWIVAQTPDDSATREEVLRLLGAHERTGGILDRGLPPLIYDVADHLQKACGVRYRIERELGHGGSAIVFQAHEEKHGRRVVLKVLKPEVVAALGTQRFMREVQIAARLAHPHILGLIDSGTAHGLPYYVMPYVQGETLRHRIQKSGPLALNESLTLLRDIADALDHAHGAGVIHRDLKPENVFCSGGHAFVMDFGIAKILEGTEGFATVAITGQSIGTPAYMAPEQAVGDPTTDHRADIYAWGLIAHELVTGKRPALGSTPPDAMRRVPRELHDLINACLVAEPDRRIQSMRVVRDALDENWGQTPIPPIPRSVWRRRAWLLGGGTAAAAVATFILAQRGEAHVTGPIAVSTLVNETRDSSLAIWGRLAGDWITQGLQEAGIASVISWPSAAQASNLIAAEQRAGTVDLVRRMREETGAGLVVTGAYYLIGDSLHFQVQVVDARTGELRGALTPVVAHRQNPEGAVRELRTRLMGQLAIWFDERLPAVRQLATRPPTFEAYRAFDRGMELYTSQGYSAAATEFRRAHEADTSFHVARIYESVCLWNTGRFGALDSALVQLAQRRSLLSGYHQQQLVALDALMQGDRTRAYAAERAAAEMAPGSKAAYNAAQLALELNRPAEALALLQTLDPDRGAMRGWSSYWTALAHAHHLLGDYNKEVEAARGMRTRFSDRRVALVLEARALAAAGKRSALDSLLEVSAGLPARTYWSHGAALETAGEEFLAHHSDTLGMQYLERARAWLAPLHSAEPDYAAHREWLATALYSMQRWNDAAVLLAPFGSDTSRRYQLRVLSTLARFRAERGSIPPLPAGSPRDVGELAFYEARLFAAAGETDKAIGRLSDALRVGVDGFPWVHGSAHRDLQLLAGDERYRRLMAPSLAR